MCEGVPNQVNFLIDEASSTGKGANATISYIIFSLITDLERAMCIFMLTIAQVRTKTIIFYGILPGEL